MDERYDRLFPLSLYCPIAIDARAQNYTSSLKLRIFKIKTCLPQDARGDNSLYGSGGNFGQHKVIEGVIRREGRGGGYVFIFEYGIINH